jgi:hypothetical protein
MGMVINTILDVMELQKGKSVFSDTSQGKISFLVHMYASKCEFRFTVTDIGKNRCRVHLEADGDTRFNKRNAAREFALLDSMLVLGAEMELEGGISKIERSS